MVAVGPWPRRGSPGRPPRCVVDSGVGRGVSEPETGDRGIFPSGSKPRLPASPCAGPDGRPPSDDYPYPPPHPRFGPPLVPPRRVGHSPPPLARRVLHRSHDTERSLGCRVGDDGGGTGGDRRRGGRGARRCREAVVRSRRTRSPARAAGRCRQHRGTAVGEDHPSGGRPWGSGCHPGDRVLDTGASGWVRWFPRRETGSSAAGDGLSSRRCLPADPVSWRARRRPSRRAPRRRSRSGRCPRTRSRRGRPSRTMAGP
jgi:hypothetical protein